MCNKINATNIVSSKQREVSDFPLLFFLLLSLELMYKDILSDCNSDKQNTSNRRSLIFLLQYLFHFLPTFVPNYFRSGNIY